MPGTKTEGNSRALSVVDADGGELPGWSRRSGDFLLTLVAGEAAGQDFAAPRSLREPAPLDSAVPTHGWQDNSYTLTGAAYSPRWRNRPPTRDQLPAM